MTHQFKNPELKAQLINGLALKFKHDFAFNEKE